MKSLGIFLVCISLAGCAVSPQKARSVSDKRLCEMNEIIASALASEVRKEIASRGVNCYDFERELAEDRRIADDNRQRANQQNRDESVKHAEEMTIMCGYCAKVYPQEIFGRCQHINKFTCGALWDNGKRPPSLPSPAPSYNCQKFGSRVNCNPY